MQNSTSCHSFSPQITSLFKLLLLFFEILAPKFPVRAWNQSLCGACKTKIYRTISIVNIFICYVFNKEIYAFYKMFCACSRIFSNSTFIIIECLPIEVSEHFAEIVLTSRFNSWRVKLMRFPFSTVSSDIILHSCFK